MEKFINKFWAIVWTVMCVLCIVAIFWNPAHWVTAGASGLMAVLFWADYIKTKNV
jgi:hypothetical protein